MRLLDNQIVNEISGGLISPTCVNGAVSLVDSCATSELAEVTKLLNQIITTAQATGASVEVIEKLLIGTLRGLLGGIPS
ncbi:MAG: hypothetical protein JSS07_06195 [Proteobacteria bacterium]|nr:hypothetical protein [Pseudomonadota bacterium]